MILGPVTLVDCAVFVLFLAPQLILQAGFFPTVITALSALPFILFTLPVEVIRAHIRPQTAVKVQDVARHRPSLFQDIVLRCVRYAFKNVPTDVGRVFFAKDVTMPFLRFRMLRHGYWSCPAQWRDIEMGEGASRFKGVWVTHDLTQQPDIVLYFLHGGGFALGSTHFYLEFLLTWHALLVQSGYRNPAIFGLDYTLVPEGRYPKQLQEAIAGYEHVLEVAGDPSRVCVGADSAGATLALSMLLELGTRREADRGANKANKHGGPSIPPNPELMILISPWQTLMLGMHENTETDYLDKFTLWRYAHQYAGTQNLFQSPACPGACDDDELWCRASPKRGYYVIYGSEEVLTGDIREFVAGQRARGVEIVDAEMVGQAHAWTVASLFLGDTIEGRLEGLSSVTEHISRCMPPVC